MVRKTKSSDYWYPGGIKKFKPQPDPPTNFRIKNSHGVAHLTWDPMPRAQAYVLFVSMDGVHFKRKIRRPFKNPVADIPELENGKTYYFGVECVGPYGRKTKMVVQKVVPGKTELSK